MCMQVCVVWVLVCLDIPFTFHFNQISEFLQNTWITSCHINATFLVHILILCSFATSENSFKNFYHLSKISELDEERMANERERAHTYGFWHKNRTPKKNWMPNTISCYPWKNEFLISKCKIARMEYGCRSKNQSKSQTNKFWCEYLMQMARKEKLCSHFLNLLTNSNISFLLSVDTVCCSEKKRYE